MKLRETCKTNLLSHVCPQKAGANGQVLIFTKAWTAVWWKWILICCCSWRVNKWALVHTHQFLPCWLSLVCSFLWGCLTQQVLKTTLFWRTVGVFEGRQLSVEVLKVSHFPIKKMRTGFLWSHLLKSTDLSWPCRLNVTRNSSTVESLYLFFCFILRKESWNNKEFHFKLSSQPWSD